MRPSATLPTTSQSGLRSEKSVTTCLSCGTGKKRDSTYVWEHTKMKYPWQLPLRLGSYILVIILRKCNWKSTPNSSQTNTLLFPRKIFMYVTYRMLGYVWKWPTLTLRRAWHLVNRLLEIVWSICLEIADTLRLMKRQLHWFTHRQCYDRVYGYIEITDFLRCTVQFNLLCVTDVWGKLQT